MERKLEILSRCRVDTIVKVDNELIIEWFRAITIKCMVTHEKQKVKNKLKSIGGQIKIIAVWANKKRKFRKAIKIEGAEYDNEEK